MPRNRAHPWGIPHQREKQRNRAVNGNAFVLFAIRGQVASIWQLPKIRKACGNTGFWTVAGHQCQYPGTDAAKPTRLLSDLPGVELFGHFGWATFDAAEYYLAPLPRTCGHGMPSR